MREIGELRGEINKVDDRLLKLLEKRAKLAKKIGGIKRAGGLPIKDAAREREIIQKAASKTSLDQKFVKKIYKDIIDYCRKNE